MNSRAERHNVQKIPLPEELLARCRDQRRLQTRPEQILWGCLRSRQLFGAKFRRQHPIGPYVVDFCCHELLLVVELDGMSHIYTAEQDEFRKRKLESLGYTVIRFSNDDVLRNME